VRPVRLAKNGPSFDSADAAVCMDGQKPLKDNVAMTGIQYLTDEKGHKVAVQIDLKKHRELWRDIEDVLVSRSRWNEMPIPLAKVRAGLVKAGKLPRE
jgi:hypothetical protein